MDSNNAIDAMGSGNRYRDTVDSDDEDVDRNIQSRDSRMCGDHGDDDEEQDVFIDDGDDDGRLSTTNKDIILRSQSKQTLCEVCCAFTCAQKFICWFCFPAAIIMAIFTIAIQPFLPLRNYLIEYPLCDCWKPIRDLKRPSSSGYMPVVQRNKTLGPLQGIAYSYEPRHIWDDDTAGKNGDLTSNIRGGDDMAFYLYEAHTKGMRVYEVRGLDKDTYEDSEIELELRRSLPYTLSTDFPQITGQYPVAHIGGITHAGPRVGSNSNDESSLWLSTHAEIDDITLSAQGALVRLNPQTMLPYDTVPTLLDRLENAFDWVAVDPRNGIGYAAEFFNITTIQRFNASSLEPLDPMKIVLPNKEKSPSTANGIQFIQSGTIGSDKRLWLLGDDYQTTLYKIDTETGRLVSSQALLIGNEVDGLEYVPEFDALLVGINGHGHSKLKSEGIYLLKRNPSDECDCATWDDE